MGGAKSPGRRAAGVAPIWIWAGAALAAAAAFAVLVPARVAEPPAASAPETTRRDYRVVNVYPHDPEAFTQGLLFHEGFLYESTGLHGRSSVRKVRLETGEILQQAPVDARHFAEGLALVDRTLVQLTWQSGLGFVYDLDSFAVLRTFPYEGEGWGLTRQGGQLIMSDGSATLRFLDAATLRETDRVEVTDAGQAVRNLNELEMVKGVLLANVWQSDEILLIAPDTGIVTDRVDLRGLLSREDRARPVDVLNGIAYDAGGDRLFVTGKLWPRLFEIVLQP